jgi:hypothetical protein
MWRRAGEIGWGLALAIAVLWPSRLIGPLDGVPLDQRSEAVAIGLALPALWFLHPRFVQGRFARVVIILLLAWKAAIGLLLGQTGLCGLFVSEYEAPAGTFRLDRSWDARTLWTSSPPRCSAIVARPFRTLEEFPAWIINVPFGRNWNLVTQEAWLPTENPRPPDGVFAMFIDGFIRPRTAGVLSLELGNDVTLTGAIAGEPLDRREGGVLNIALDRGEHAVDLRLDLRRFDWRFVPKWNGADLFQALPPATRSSTLLDRAVGPWGAWVTPVIVGVLLVGWLGAAVADLRRERWLVAWAAGSAAAMALVGALVDTPGPRWAVLLLLGGIVIAVPASLKNARGAFLVFGLGWLALFAGRGLEQIGRFTIYSFGDDWLTFQRYAHRIYIEGYWLEGGQRTFWYQPFYRWIAGALHVIFGESSVGEFYWDAAGVLVGGLVAFVIVNRIAGFRAGVTAGALTLSTVALGPSWYLIGRGLSEISAAMWLSLSALVVLQAPRPQMRHALAAGIFAALAFFTRLNLLLMAATLVLFFIAGSPPAEALWSPRTLWRNLSKQVAATYAACLFAAVGLLAARTWYYTGRFDPFAGTQREHLGTGLGPESLFSLEAWRRAGESVLMIATVQDPPRFDVRAVLVTGGVCCALLGLVRVPVVRGLPLAPAMFCVSALAGGLVARGTAYPGRFSMQLIPVAVALAVAAIALAAGRPSEALKGSI